MDEHPSSPAAGIAAAGAPTGKSTEPRPAATEADRGCGVA